MPAGLALYVHWPFCLAKCPYCDFNSHVEEAIDQDRWRRALLAELDYFLNDTKVETVSSIYFGGGTPSLMEPRTVACLIEAAGEGRGLSEDVEITIEANPSSVLSEIFCEFSAAGVNRLSLGVQSLDDKALAFLGRGHTAAVAREALQLAAQWFPRFSFDMIYGLPGQTAKVWRRQLARALELAGGHLSLYQLTVEPATPFHRSGVRPADEETAIALYRTTREMCEANAMPSYEVSNYARPGEPCRHNLHVWRGGSYAGIGPGAHGRLAAGGGHQAVRQIAEPGRWLEAVEKKGHGTAQRTLLSSEQRGEELLMTGLRLGEGVDGGRFRRLTGRSLEEALDGEKLRRLVEGGFLLGDGHGLAATPSGRLALNEVIAQLLG